MHKNVIRDLSREELFNKNLAKLDRQMHVEKQYRDAQEQERQSIGTLSNS